MTATISDISTHLPPTPSYHFTHTHTPAQSRQPPWGPPFPNAFLHVRGLTPPPPFLPSAARPSRRCLPLCLCVMGSHPTACLPACGRARERREGGQHLISPARRQRRVLLLRNQRGGDGCYRRWGRGQESCSSARSAAAAAAALAAASAPCRCPAPTDKAVPSDTPSLPLPPRPLLEGRPGPAQAAASPNEHPRLRKGAHPLPRPAERKDGPSRVGCACAEAEKQPLSLSSFP